MGVKFYSLLILCHILFTSGNFIPMKNKFINRHIRNKTIESFPKPRKNVSVVSTEPLFTVGTITYQTTTETLLTTESITTTEGLRGIITVPSPTRECPEGLSSITEKDLNDTIIFFARNNSQLKTINESYFNLAMSIRNKHLKNVDKFLTKLRNKPDHLNHILEEIQQLRNSHIEPLVNTVVRKIPEIRSLHDQYNERVNNAKKQLENYEKINKICALNCDEPLSDSRRKRSNVRYPDLVLGLSSSRGIYYCTSLKDVKIKINDVLSQFGSEYIETLNNSLIEIDRNYTENLEKLKSSLKNAAVQEFGRTMYDILSIEDEHYHFLEFLNGETGISQFEVKMRKIRKANLQIDYKTEELKSQVENYRKYCLSCDSKRQRLRRDLLRLELPRDNFRTDVPITVLTTHEPDTEPTKDILDKLLDIYKNEVQNKIQIQKDEIFGKLNDIVTDQENAIETLLFNISPIKKTIIDALELQENELNNLKIQVPESLLDDLKTLNENSKNIQNSLEEALQNIQNAIGQ